MAFSRTGFDRSEQGKRLIHAPFELTASLTNSMPQKTQIRWDYPASVS
jgi:hypothetical protein